MVEEEVRNARVEMGVKATSKKVPRKRPKTVTVATFSKRAEDQLLELRSHLIRNSVIKKTIKEKKIEVLEDRTRTKALLHVDWNESYQH